MSLNNVMYCIRCDSVFKNENSQDQRSDDSCLCHNLACQNKVMLVNSIFIPIIRSLRSKGIFVTECDQGFSINTWSITNVPFIKFAVSKDVYDHSDFSYTLLSQLKASIKSHTNLCYLLYSDIKQHEFFEGANTTIERKFMFEYVELVLTVKKATNCSTNCQVTTLIEMFEYLSEPKVYDLLQKLTTDLNKTILRIPVPETKPQVQKKKPNVSMIPRAMITDLLTSICYKDMVKLASLIHDKDDMTVGQLMTQDSVIYDNERAYHKIDHDMLCSDLLMTMIEFNFKSDVKTSDNNNAITEAVFEILTDQKCADYRHLSDILRKDPEATVRTLKNDSSTTVYHNYHDNMLCSDLLRKMIKAKYRKV